MTATINDQATQPVSEGATGRIARVIGPVAKPAHVVFVPDVPKTRSGKIMRRLLTQLFTGDALGDTTSLQNEPCVAQIAEVVAALETAGAVRG